MAEKLKFLHLAKAAPRPRLLPPEFVRRMSELGEVVIRPDSGRLSPDEVLAAYRDTDVALMGWDSVRLPEALAGAPGKLRYVCNITGTVRETVPREIITSGLPVTNWGDAPAHGIAEGAMALLLACLKVLPAHAASRRTGGWNPPEVEHCGTLRGMRVGLYGYGVIGRAFHDLLRAFGAKVAVFDPYIKELPDDATRVGTLLELFSQCDAVALHASLTPETHRSVRAEHFTALRDQGIVINTARGDLIDQEALFAELASGRLRAGLDVLCVPETLPPDHPARGWPNLILTGHIVWGEMWPDPNRLFQYHLVALENLGLFIRGEPVRFLIDERRYELST